MAFRSEHAPRIWNDLYNVMIPDQVTQNPQYLRIFGVHITGNKAVDRTMENALTNVKIPIIKILEYYNDGVEVHIVKRESMINIHRNIEKYLDEWRNHINIAVNSSLPAHKDLVLGLEKLSKFIYGKAYPNEVVQNPMLTTNMGMLNPLARMQLAKETPRKPDYSGISSLVRKNLKNTRY